MSKNFVGPTFFPPLGPAKVSGAIRPTGWDRAVLADQVLPGYCSVLKGGIRLKLDPKAKAGANNSNPTAHGLALQEFELECITYSDEDRETLASIIRTVAPQDGRITAPVSFDHPSVRAIGITAVQVIGISALIPVSPGVAKQMFELFHWQPPKTNKSATTTPTRKIDNRRKKANDAANNPPPTQQADAWAPPDFTGSSSALGPVK